MKTRFAFGKHGIDVEVPAGFDCHVAHARSAAAIADVASAIDDALDNPIGCEPLVKLAGGRRTAAISVCDITRPAPNCITLPPLLKRLHAAGIPVEGVTILIATGLHRTATQDELIAILGPEVAGKYRAVSHDARDLAAHRSLGVTRRGTPVSIDERFIAADLRITLGFVEQHLMLGFSGGRKLVAPGLAAQETIKAIHSPRFMREPLATEGSIDGNPLHAELLEIAAMAGHHFMLDVTLTQERAISGVFAGDPVKAHAAGVRFLESTSTSPTPALADAVITCAAGYPLDLTFYQTVKGLTAAQHIVKPGGRILVLGECAEGIGSPEFARMLAAYRGHAEFLDEIRETRVEVDQWQLEKLALVGVKNETFFYTPGADAGRLGWLGQRVYGRLDEAVAGTLEGLAPDALVVLVPEGPYAFARVQPTYA
jgi:nickel-dependent lactate racemase